MKSKSEKRWLSDVASLGCVACRNSGYGETLAEVHHVRAGVGKGQRAADTDTIPLCPPHHRGTLHPMVPSIHLDKRRFEREFGTELELLAQTIRDVNAFRSTIVGSDL